MFKKLLITLIVAGSCSKSYGINGSPISPKDAAAMVACCLIRKDDNFRKLAQDRSALSAMLSFNHIFDKAMAIIEDLISNADVLKNNIASLKQEVHNVTLAINAIPEDNTLDLADAFDAGWKAVFNRDFDGQNDAAYLNILISMVAVVLSLDGVDLYQECNMVMQYAESNPVMYHYCLKWLQGFVDQVDHNVSAVI